MEAFPAATLILTLLLPTTHQQNQHDLSTLTKSVVTKFHFFFVLTLKRSKLNEFGLFGI